MTKPDTSPVERVEAREELALQKLSAMGQEFDRQALSAPSQEVPMSDDLVKRLRDDSLACKERLGIPLGKRTISEEAADRIERLEAALRELTSYKTAMLAGLAPKHVVEDGVWRGIDKAEALLAKLEKEGSDADQD